MTVPGKNAGSISHQPGKAAEFELHWINADNAHLLENVAAGVFDEAIVPARLMAYLANPANMMCVAMSGDLVVGMVMCVVHLHPDKPTELYLDEIGTGDVWRRQGVARALMLKVFERADDEDIEEIWLGTEPDNTPAIGLYESFGVKPEKALIYYLDW
ncbi:GNAT family N-acetyltransferase [Erythrobacter sp. Alg231-14]|uniref:GNAT family N-acetyltransferase n=1 Tax=Erythrobacter sp. Alg231-14 TaxID=1922225 RepID=UPI00307C8E02